MEDSQPTSLGLSWAAPEPPNGVITKYNITWRSADGEEENYITTNNETSYTITGLDSCKSYYISVAAATSKGFGNASEETTGDTLVGKLNQTARL